jgi:hypothetical protein
MKTKHQKKAELIPGRLLSDFDFSSRSTSSVAKPETENLKTQKKTIV